MKYCAFEDCSREAYKSDLCNAHRQQRKRGTPLHPLRDAQGGKFGGNATGRLKRAAIAYADAELEDEPMAWKNLADAARWFTRGEPKSANKPIAEIATEVHQELRKLGRAMERIEAGEHPRTP